MRNRARPTLLAVALAALVLAGATGCREGITYTYTECQLDDQPAAQCQTPVAYPDLSPGPHTVTVRAINCRLDNQERDEWSCSHVGQDQWSWTVLPPGTRQQ